MRWVGSVLLLLIGFAMLGAATEANAERPSASQYRMYVIDVRLLKTMANGEERELSCPTIATVEDRVAEFQSGNEIRPPEGVKLEDPLRDSTNYRIRVFRNKSRLFLEVRGSIANVSRQDADGVRVTETGLSVVEAFALGKKIVVPVPESQQCRWEILVQEAKLEQNKNPQPSAEGQRGYLEICRPRSGQGE